MKLISILKRKVAHGAYLATLYWPFEFMARVRSFLLKAMTGAKASGLVVRPGVYILSYSNLSFGNNLSLNHNCFISCAGGLSIGSDVSIAHGVTIMTTEHGFSDARKPIKFQDIKYDPVTIGDNVWIGAKATILAGVNLPAGTIVAAGAVVTRSPELENQIVAGVPARVIKGRL